MEPGELRLPMFPLGMVLFPHMELSLRAFEERYLALVADCLASRRQFGVVLIERGHEVGGGDTRFGLGTVARIVAEARAPDRSWLLQTTGAGRVEVVTWLPDDPYPLALVRPRPEPGPPSPDRLAGAERTVRRSLALAVEAGLKVPPATFTLDEDPSVAVYQLCARAPVGALDRQSLLEAPDHDSRLDLLEQRAGEALELFARQIGGR
ncbi:MAG TPA: LON peptidase substrate-binding domain-containing protein [Acidimicrobiales bacterium]|nr:LON peptidase substrate-binding domain-containing protein [Acidimicrobiales bacterium]